MYHNEKQNLHSILRSMPLDPCNEMQSAGDYFLRIKYRTQKEIHTSALHFTGQFFLK